MSASGTLRRWANTPQQRALVYYLRAIPPFQCTRALCSQTSSWFFHTQLPFIPLQLLSAPRERVKDKLQRKLEIRWQKPLHTRRHQWGLCSVYTDCHTLSILMFYSSDFLGEERPLTLARRVFVHCRMASLTFHLQPRREEKGVSTGA